ncbi:hypothetical protein GCM10027275_52910 [Rhabdobacter roseus]|uniref:Ligand-binding SRPBCC domain-containing protein n=1 Tax=Rhabdobacter roseus TaxID=1655419 RepID=A0A840U1S5_9BACT|nr:hypothetical protein [Rhabdobacter roseus]MBB5286318.1 ligand-binding SRPBCC domain-containing protein [Rhabdobacter roseus]
MKLTLSTSVAAPLARVWRGFDATLFQKLSPPFPPVRLLRFDGSQRGDVVSLELNFLFFKQRWISEITEQAEVPDEIYFVDQGTRLPFFLTYWRHKHRLIRHGQGTLIRDEIEYRTPLRVLDYLLYPLLYAQFAYRKPIYKKVFDPEG